MQGLATLCTCLKGAIVRETIDWRRLVDHALLVTTRQVTDNKGSTGRTHFQSGFHRLATAWKHGFTAQDTSVVLEVAGLQFLQ